MLQTEEITLIGKAIMLCFNYAKTSTAIIAGLLYHQLHETVVLADVPFQDVLAWPKNTLKTSTVKLDTLEESLGGNRSSTGSLQQQSNLA